MPEPEPWQVLASETLLDSPPWLRVVRQAVQLPGGTVLDDYILAAGRDFSLVVAVNAEGEALLVRQYKHGIGRVLLEFPAGYLDEPGEDPLAAAQRELREETGYEAARWDYLGSYCQDPNRAVNVATLYLARDLTRVGPPKLDDSERIEVLAVPLNTIPELLRSGAMPSLSSAAAWGLAAGVLNAP